MQRVVESIKFVHFHSLCGIKLWLDVCNPKKTRINIAFHIFIYLEYLVLNKLRQIGTSNKVGKKQWKTFRIPSVWNNEGIFKIRNWMLMRTWTVWIILGNSVASVYWTQERDMNKWINKWMNKIEIQVGFSGRRQSF